MCHFIINALPIVTVIVIILWSIYVYVYEMCILMISNVIQQIIYLVIFGILLFLMLFMYIFLLCKKHFEFPAKYTIPPDIIAQLRNVTTFRDEYNILLELCRARGIKVFTRNDTGQIRYCRECQIIKPDRTHHCTKCDTCIMKMDHHCPWINNCVGYANHKYFVQLTFISAVFCTYVTLTSIEFVYYFFRRFHTRRIIGRLNVVVLPIIAGGIGIALWVLFFFHLHLILKNMTTLESMYPPTFTGPIESTFDQGRSANCHEEWSSNCCGWLCPTDTMEGNGVDFDVIEYTEE